MGFSSGYNPFLDTTNTSDAVPDPNQNARLSRLEADILRTKRLWLDTEYSQQLTAIVARIIEDRRDSPMSTAICLGICGNMRMFGSLQYQRGILQLVAFSQIVAQLAAANSELLNNIVFQDPNMGDDFKVLLQGYGCRVVNDPEAFDLLGPNTFLFSAFVERQYLFAGLMDQIVEELGMFVGNGEDLLIRTSEDASNPDTRPETLAFETLIATMLGKEMFNYEEFPCDRPNGKAYNVEGPRSGLSSFDIWWKPVRTEIQKAQDKVLRSFMKSCRTGFNGNFVEFGRAYRAGFADLEQSLQTRIIYSFIAACYYTNRTLVFADYFLGYVLGLNEVQKEYEILIDAYLHVEKSMRDTIPFVKYIEGRPIVA